ncbi:hypothetical protein PTD2_09154 [Pseudoalteromonas tunicata D2]|jgi:hypothetical protein|uniref:Uncharacterized protein n=2 Tax=Pseudoalteromonas tunicata TaxID=314281 RepID=A4C9D6_9GAMM|nr:hypothetical protein PTD2_09154 [Pseudoalteromonas tunicata D2]
MIVAAGIGCALSSFTSEANYTDYVPYNGWEATGVLTYGNNFNKSITNKELLKITRKVGSILSYENNIRQKIKAEIQEAISGEASLASYDFQILGDLEVKLIGLSDGTIEARVGNISISAYAKIKKSWYAKGKIRVSSNKLTLIGKYNPYSGKLSGLRANSGFKMNVDVDVDSILDLLIPLFNSQFTNKLEDSLKVGFENSIISALNSRLDGYEDVLLGLDRYLPKNQYIYRGEDYAIKVENAFKDLISNESLTVKLTSRQKSLKFNKDTPNITINRVDINVSNNLFLNIYDDPIIETEFRPECNGNDCTVEP